MHKKIYSFQKILTVIPTFLFSLGSCSVCPFCLPFYAGFFGLLGLKGGTYNYYLFLALMVAMFISLVYAVYMSVKSKQYWLLFLVLCGFLVTFFSKIYDKKILLYLGLTIFVISIFRIKRFCKSCNVSENKKTAEKKK
jgi:uncharacterized membrane protein